MTRGYASRSQQFYLPLCRYYLHECTTSRLLLLHQDTIHIFKDCSLQCVGRNDPFDPFPSKLPHTAFDGLESNAAFPSQFTQAANVTLKLYCVLFASRHNHLQTDEYQNLCHPLCR